MNRIRVIVALVVSIVLLNGLLCAQTANPRIRRVLPRDRVLDRDAYRNHVSQLSAELVRQAEYLSLTSYDYFMGWNGEINRNEQLVLFKSEEFTASCRLFNKLVSDQSNYFRSESLRNNLFNALRYLTEAFHELEKQMLRLGFRDGFSNRRRDGRAYDKRSRPGPSSGQWSLRECRQIIEEIEAEFRAWQR